MNLKSPYTHSIATALLVVAVALLFTIPLTHIQPGGIRHAGAGLAAQGAIDPCHAKVPYPPAQTLNRNDDQSSDRIPLPLEMSPLNFLGRSVDALWVNNNGNITLDGPLQQYTPFTLLDTNRAIIAPYFADVDTTPSDGGQVSYGVTEFDGRLAFCVTWDSVGYFDQQTDRTSTFQLLLVSRSNLGEGFFDIIFNYDRIQWESGDASGGTDGLGGRVARLGYANGSSSADTAFEFSAAGVPGTLIDGGTSELRSARRHSQHLGQLIFEIRAGQEPLTGGGNGDNAIVYAALGDSFSAGVGTQVPPPEKENNPCYRTVEAYGWKLAFLMNDYEPRPPLAIVPADTIFAACGGARTRHIASTGQTQDFEPDWSNEDWSQEFASNWSPDKPQIEHLSSAVDIATLTIGGNDVGFSAFLAYCVAIPNCHQRFEELEKSTGLNEDPNEVNIRGLYNRLFDTYSKVLLAAPNATVFVLGYPNLLSDWRPDSGCFIYRFLEGAEVSYIQRLTRLLNSVIREAAADVGVHFVDIAGSAAGSTNRGVCSHPGGTGGYIVDPHFETREVVGFEILWAYKENFFHPNARAHTAYLNVLLEEWFPSWDNEEYGSLNDYLYDNHKSFLSELPKNPIALLRRGPEPTPSHTFSIGFIENRRLWVDDETTPEGSELVASFDVIGGRACFASVTCNVGVRISGRNPGDQWTAYVYSDEVLIASGTVSEDGSIDIESDNLVLSAGLHTFVLELLGPNATEIMVHQFVVEDPNEAEESVGLRRGPAYAEDDAGTDSSLTDQSSEPQVSSEDQPQQMGESIGARNDASGDVNLIVWAMGIILAIALLVMAAASMIGWRRRKAHD